MFQQNIVVNRFVYFLVFYPFGLENGDKRYNGNDYDDSSTRLDLKRTILFFSNPVSTLYVSKICALQSTEQLINYIIYNILDLFL